MMLIFNQILSDSSDINLTMNSLKKYNAGSDYILEPFGITEDDNDAQLSIVWSDKKYKYTPGDPSAENINVTLIDLQESLVPSGPTLLKTATVSTTCTMSNPETGNF